MTDVTVGALAPPRPARKAEQSDFRKKLGFFSMVLGMFMAILDIQIVSSSLREIQAGLSASADEISWIQTSYLIAEVVMIPLSGTLSRLLSTRVLFVMSAAAFTASSLLCALAWNIESMIVFRVLQGFLGGAMIPTVFASLYIMFPPEKRAGVSVLIGLTATMAPTIGPTLGGYLTQLMSWHWLFLINVVPGTAVVIMVWTLLDIDRPDRTLLKGFDFLGLLFMALFLGSLEFVMEEGPRKDWFENSYITDFTVLAAVAAVAFFWRVLTYKQPIVDLRSFRDRNFAVGCLYAFIIGIGLYGAVYIVPQFLGQVRQYNSLQIGTIMAVVGIFQCMSAPIAGAMARKFDPRVLLTLGLTLFATGLFLNSRLTADASFGEFFLPQAVRGLALILCMLPINQLALGTLSPLALKNASGLFNLMRNLGGAIGLAGINTVIADRLALHQARLADNLNIGRPEVQSVLDGLSARLAVTMPGDTDKMAIKVVWQMLTREAYVLTFNDCLLIMAGVFAMGLLFMPLLRKPKPAPAGAAGGH